MTDSAAVARPKTTRALATLAALATAGLLGVLTPVAAAAPVSAAEGAGCPEGFGATAASNTLAIGGIDLRALGIDQPSLPEVRAATTHAGFAGGPARAAADARYLQSSGALPAGVLGPAAYQQAPPPPEQPVTVPVHGVDLGALALGAGSLSAHATWRDAARCTATAGPVAESEAKLADLEVLPGRGDRALLRFGALRSASVTQVGTIGDRTAATAAATGGADDFTLLAGAVGVQVVSAPSLKVAAAGGKRSVDYRPPVLEVAAPGRHAVRLDSAGEFADIVVPVDGRDRAEAEAIADAENLPIAADSSLRDLLSGITTGLSGAVEGAAEATESLSATLGLPGLPAVGGGEATVRPAEGALRHPAKTAVLRVELGALDRQDSGTGVYARAFSIRIKLIARTNPRPAADGYGGTVTRTDQVTVLDLGICTLEAAAAAPRTGGGYGGQGNGPDYGGVSGGGDVLPVTGPGAAAVAGLGLLLVVAGGMLLVASRRRLDA